MGCKMLHAMVCHVITYTASVAVLPVSYMFVSVFWFEGESKSSFLMQKSNGQ